MVTKVQTVALSGLDGTPVTVETDVNRAEQLSLDIVGLPDASIKEAKDRIRSALFNSGYKLANLRIVLNLAPASLRKEGSSYDLAMVLGLLSSTGQIEPVDPHAVFIGELSLSGEVRPCSGVLAAVISAKQNGFTDVYVPIANAREGSVIDGVNVYGVPDLCALTAHLEGKQSLTPSKTDISVLRDRKPPAPVDFSDIIGQQVAKRACEIAAAGGHNLLLIGPPGAGKSMLAKALPTIMPDMTEEEMLESSKIYSVAGKLTDDNPLVVDRPFVRTNQSVSVAGMTGGGSIPGPGVISMAHNGVLFLDEVAEFGPKVLDSLRQPLEDHCVTVSRVKKTVTYPCSFTLVCAMNPCPCGHFGHPTIRCTCTRSQIDKYLNRISGPLLDRIDLQVELPPVPVTEIRNGKPAEPSAAIRERVNRARRIQEQRYAGSGVTCNGKITPKQLADWCKSCLTADAEKFLTDLFARGNLSMRAYDKIIRIARTIADLAGSEKIEKIHVAEAAFYRSLDRKYWNR